MPITIQNNKLQIRNAEGNYVNIDAVSDATVAERLTEINATAQTQISAIEQKGVETLANIPSDYTELSDEVDDLKSAVQSELDFSGSELVNQKKYIVAHWVRGAIRNNSGVDLGPYLYRIRTSNTLYTSTDIVLYAEKGYSLLVYYYDATGEYLNFVESGQNNTITIPTGSYYRCVIRTIQEDTESLADIYDYVTHVYYDFSVTYIRSDIEQSKSNREQIIAIKNIGTGGFVNLFPEQMLTKNLYNPDYEIKNKRIDLTTGNLVDDSNYNLYKITVPSGKTLLCTGIKSSLPNQRSYANVVRSNVIYNNYGVIESTDSQSMSASVYKNTNSTDRTAFLNLWSATNPSLTVTDLMIEFVDNSTQSSEYITDYLPYGFVNNYSIYGGLHNKLHNPRKVFTEEISDTVTKVLSAQEKVSYTFAFITDTHFTPNNVESQTYTEDTFSNLKRVSELIPFDAVIHGGDMVSVGWGGTTQEETNEYINMMRGWMLQSSTNGHVYMTPGNHDGIDGRSTPQTGLYAPMMSHDERFVERINDSYDYYFDVKKPALRVIVLSDAVIYSGKLGVSDDTMAWCKNVLDTTPSGFNVLIVSHIGPQSDDFSNNKSAFCELLNSWNNHTGDYTSNTGKIIAWVAGHQHYDWIVPTSSSGCDFPVIICTCSFRNAIVPSAGLIAKGAEAVSPRTMYTVLQDAWTIFVYRPDLGKIKKIRFGAGNDSDVDYVNWDTSN